MTRARGTGRTMRMLEAAFALAVSEPTRHVVVIGANGHHARSYREHFAEKADGSTDPLLLARIHVCAIHDRTRTCLGLPGTPAIFWDHFAVEVHAMDLRTRIQGLESTLADMREELAATLRARTS